VLLNSSISDDLYDESALLSVLAPSHLPLHSLRFTPGRISTWCFSPSAAKPGDPCKIRPVHSLSEEMPQPPASLSPLQVRRHCSSTNVFGT